MCPHSFFPIILIKILNNNFHASVYGVDIYPSNSVLKEAADRRILLLHNYSFSVRNLALLVEQNKIIKVFLFTIKNINVLIC